VTRAAVPEGDPGSALNLHRRQLHIQALDMQTPPRETGS
jgi:hypothetical protein